MMMMMMMMMTIMMMINSYFAQYILLQKDIHVLKSGKGYLMDLMYSIATLANDNLFLVLSSYNSVLYRCTCNETWT